MKAFLYQLDPVDEWAVEAAVTHPVFDELFGAIIDEQYGAREAAAVLRPSQPSSLNQRHRKSVVVVAAGSHAHRRLSAGRRDPNRSLKRLARQLTLAPPSSLERQMEVRTGRR